MQPRQVTTAELADLLRPYIGKRLRGDLSAYVEIEAPSMGATFCNADIRDVRAGYVEVFFYRGCDLVPLTSIRRIVIRGVDGEGYFTSETAYEHVAAKELAA